MSDPSNPRFDEALAFAARAHSAVGQSRKGTAFPYVVHPIRVADILDRFGLGEDVVVAGFLHDTIEDTAVTAVQVEAEFGPRVRQLVEAVSEPDKGARWKLRKQLTIDHLAAEDDHDILALTAADKLDNVRSTSDMLLRFSEPEVWGHFSAPQAEQHWYYRSIAAILRRKDPDSSLFHALDDETRELFPDP
jgi:(p)ppGpp synthase/HD superfamily hydrolase